MTRATLSPADVEALRQSAQWHASLQRGGNAVVSPETLLLLLDVYEDCQHVEAENERLVDELKGADFTIGELERAVEDLQLEYEPEQYAAEHWGIKAAPFGRAPEKK